MAKIYSFRKVITPKANRLPFEVPYYKMVETACDHPQTWITKDQIVVRETLYRNGLIKCPRCGLIYDPELMC